MHIDNLRPGPQYHVPRLDLPEAREWVEHYRVMIRRGLYIPPITIDKRGFIVDGHHRWRAHVLEGKQEINARLG